LSRQRHCLRTVSEIYPITHINEEERPDALDPCARFQKNGFDPPKV
jgi:hypothetical protein